MTAIVADAGDTQGQALPEVVVLYLGDGDVELGSNPGEDGLRYSPFPLQALVARQPQAGTANAYVHASPPPREMTVCATEKESFSRRWKSRAGSPGLRDTIGPAKPFPGVVMTTKYRVKYTKMARK